MIDEKEKKILINLDRVIKALEYEQKENYSATRNLVLSYLYDIKNNTVPKKMPSDEIGIES